MASRWENFPYPDIFSWCTLWKKESRQVLNRSVSLEERIGSRSLLTWKWHTAESRKKRHLKWFIYMSHDKMCFWEFLTRSDSNRPAQPQKLAWGLKFWLQTLEALHYLGSEQQRRWSDCADAQADLRLSVAPSEASSLGIQAAPSSIPTSGTFFHGDLVMKTFLRPFSLFCWFKKSSCQLLAKECALSTGKLPRRLAQEQCG